MSGEVILSVVVPTHNPHLGRLEATLTGLCRQTLSSDRWELLLVENASARFPEVAWIERLGIANLRIVPEPKVGLTHARRRGFEQALGRYLVMVDDDNVLAPCYLSEVCDIFDSNPELGAIGGPARGRFPAELTPWQAEFTGLLATRDLGSEARAGGLALSHEGRFFAYPPYAPIGAGMALRKEAALHWVKQLDLDPQRVALDRRGNALVSGGDNDIVLTVLEMGYEVGYFPTLALEHIIPEERLELEYLMKINRAIQRSWMQVLSLHNANPWPAIPAWTGPLRIAKAWFAHKAWSSPTAKIRFAGARGHFEGRARMRHLGKVSTARPLPHA